MLGGRREKKGGGAMRQLPKKRKARGKRRFEGKTKKGDVPKILLF